MKTRTVALSPARAFALFTREIGLWWPLPQFSVSGSAETAFLEPAVGGLIGERDSSATAHRWGRVTSCDEPRRLECLWHPGRPEATAQRLVVEFDEIDGRTLMTLIHDGWGCYGEGAESAIREYDGGWDAVLARYVEASERTRRARGAERLLSLKEAGA